MAEEMDKPDGEKPAAESPEDAGAPEVEAEVVAESDLGGNVDDDQTFSEPKEEEKEKAPPSSAAKKSGLTPGVVLFVAFLVAALAVIAVWRLLPHKASPEQPAITEEEPAAPAEQGATAAPEVATTPAPDTRAQGEPAGPEATKTPPPDASKIANDAAAEAKEPEFVAPSGDSENAAPPDEPFLPPLPSAGDESGNLSLQQSAKEAFRGVETPDEKDTQDQPAPEQANEAPSFDVEAPIAQEQDALAGEEASAEDAAEAAADHADVAEPPTVAETLPSESGAKIANDYSSLKDAFGEEIASLKSQLAEERDRNAAQRAEIERMRRDFQAALEARDAQENDKIAALSERLDKIQNDEGIAAGRRRAQASLALSALERAASSGAPFEAELDTLAGLAPRADEIAQLRPFAASGAPTVAVLKQTFAAAARAGLAASRRAEAKGVFGELAARAQNLISVRPAEPVAGDSAGAVISRAENHIDNGDISAGLAELKTLPAPVQEAMKDWLDKAEARAAVEDAIASLQGRLAVSAG